MSPLNAAICTTTYLERQTCYGPGKNILFKKQFFDLEVKGQGPTKVITVRDTPPFGHAPTYQISLTYLEKQKCYSPDKKILFKKQLFDLEVKGHYGMRHTALWSCIHIPNKYYLKNNYLTLKSKVKVPRKLLRYTTHHLMVMHQHTKYH
jgi:hypothetical protein